MRAVVVHETGGPEVLLLEELPDPEPGEGDLLVRVHAAALNAIDWKFRRGVIAKPLPAVLGSDISGVVEISRNDAFAAGDEVFGFAASGAYAERAIAVEGRIVRKPAGLAHVQAAALPVAGLTAWEALLERAALQEGQRVLIAGAAGGVGHLAVQLAARAGAEAIGVGSPRNREFVLSLGARGYVDYKQTPLQSAGVGADVAFDAVGGETTGALLENVRPGGLLVTIAGVPPEERAQELGVRVERLVMTPDAERLAALGELAAAGELRVEIAHELALEEVVRAHELLESGHTRGKIVLRVAGAHA